MSAQHTPGPWSFRKNYNGSLDFFAEDGARVIMCNARLLNQDANARLIAAAPDLLDAAIKTVEENGHLADGDNRTLIHLVRAITKAIGGAI